MTTSRKQREKDIDLYATGSTIVALLAGVVVWQKSQSLALGIVVLFVGMAAMGGLLYLLTLRRRRNLREQARMFSWSNWEEFEASLVAIFVRKGYRAQLTPNGSDFGADLVVDKDGIRTVVQAKHWQSRNVGVKAVQEVATAKAYYRASESLVVTTTHFTEQATELARKNRVQLWDRDRLAAEIRALAQQAPSRPVVQPAPALANAAPMMPAAAPTVAPALAAVACPRCGGNMLRRTSRYGAFWGCASYPSCRGTRPA